MNYSDLSKRRSFRRLMIFVTVIIIAIFITLLILFIEKRKFYNEEIRPFVDIISVAECSSEPCYSCEADTGKYEYYKCTTSEDLDKIYSVDISKGFKRSAQVYICTSKPYSDKSTDRQYEVNIHVFIDKKGDYTWQVSIDENISRTSKAEVFVAEINPKTLEISDVLYSEDSSIDYVKECKPEIEEAIKDLRTFFSPCFD